MKRVAAIGDNCIDFYRGTRQKYPTGNAVDTAVNLQKLGVPTSIISTTGSDSNGAWMIETLQREGLDTSHLKIADGPTAITYMELDGLDRVHGEYMEGVLANISFDEEDIRFACEHDLVHTALWGNAEAVLQQIHDSGTLVSFDYCDRLDNPLVESTLGSVDIGFYSYHGDNGRDSWIERFLQDKVARGLRIATATFGEKGSLSWNGERFFDGPVYPAAAVNTVGAGDSFIAGFIASILNGESIECGLDQGAQIAAQVVEVFEPWVTSK